MSADRVVEEGRRPPAPHEEPLLGPAPRPDQGRLDRLLLRLELLLSILGFHQPGSISRAALSSLASILLGLAIPIASVILSKSLDGGLEVWRFELWSLISQAVHAGISAVFVSINLCSGGGLRPILFLDHDQERRERFRDEYVENIQRFFKILLRCISLCLPVNIIRHAIISWLSAQNPLWKSAAIAVTSILGWAYLALISMTACALFNLVCDIQIIHLEDFKRRLEIEREFRTVLNEHSLLLRRLNDISHAFRCYLIFSFLWISFSQVVALFQTTGHAGEITFLNAAGLIMTSAVQVLGMILCLYSASRISHRAQGVASQAGKWNASITCEADRDRSEVRVQAAHSPSSYHKRQSLVMYFQGNPGGITVYGHVVDRTLIVSIIFFELSLVLFVLGKTIGLSNEKIGPD